jgi:hypothetical protein
MIFLSCYSYINTYESYNLCNTDKIRNSGNGQGIWGNDVEF